MTTASTTSAMKAAAPERRRNNSFGVALRYLGATLRLNFTDGAFIGFMLAMPTAMYLFFAQVYGGDPTYGAEAKRQIMLQMATYGAMGSALSAGNAIQLERSTGWFRQLMVSALTPLTFFVVRVVAALIMLIPPLALVLVVGCIDGVQLPFGTWFAVAGVALLVLTPFVVMGLVIGLWLKPSAASPATTFIMLSMAMLGGMWVPLDMMPEFLQSLGTALPSYWAVEFSKLPVSGDPIPGKGLLVLGAWLLAMVVLGVLGYRRAITTSKR